MFTAVQIVRITWNKDQRSVAHARARAQLPDVYPFLPIADENTGPLVVHTPLERVVVENAHDSAFEQEWRVGPLMIRHELDCTVVVHAAGGVHTATPRQLAALLPGKWLQVKHNARRTLEEGWLYESTTFNIGRWNRYHDDLFRDSPPTHRVDLRVDLYRRGYKHFNS